MACTDAAAPGAWRRNHGSFGQIAGQKPADKQQTLRDGVRRSRRILGESVEQATLNATRLVAVRADLGGAAQGDLLACQGEGAKRFAPAKRSVMAVATTDRASRKPFTRTVVLPTLTL